MASVEAEAPSRHQSADRSPSPVDRSPSPPRRDRSLSRDSRVSRDSRDSRDISPPRRDRSVSRDSRDSRDASLPPRDRSLSRGPRDSRDISPIPRDRSRDRSRDQSRDRSPPRRQSPPPPARRDADRYRPAKRERTPPPPPPPVKSEEEKLADARAEYQKLLNLRSQGVYLPPQKLRALQAAITDKTTKEYQRMAWDALKKSINGLVNKINTANIKFVVPELFGENLIRGRGLFCQSLLKAQHASLPFTPIYACLAAICNTKLPQVGELLVKRLIMRFRKGFKRNDKAVCLSSTMFIAHLVNNQVVHENLAAQILILLLQKPTDDSVEIAVGLMREVGLFLEEMKPKVAHIVFDRFRNILHEADIDRRTQYMIEVLFQVRKDKYKDNPVIKEELDLVEEEDQITHQIGLDDDINTQDSLNVFKYDPDWEANEEEYKKLKADILGEGSDDEDEDESESESESEDEEQKAVEIKDQSNADLVNLRRTIYLTIQSSADPEEAAHKLMKLRLPAGQESELVSMIIESCAQEKVYLKFMGLLGERFARLNRMWTDLFEESFMKYYSTIHRYETNKLRNIARFFGHLLSSDAIGWHVFSAVRLTEDDTTSSSRIFLSILLEDLQENMGTAKLKARMSDEMLQPSLEGMFPHDNPRNTRFAINYFTAVKMGFLTDEMRTFLANMPKPALPAAPPPESDSDSASSYSSYSRSSYSSRSRSRTPRKAIDRGRSISRTPPRRTRDRSYSRSYTRSVSSRRSLSRSPPPRRGRDLSRDRSLSRTPSRSRSPSYSRSPPPRRGRPRTRSRSYSRSISRSRSPPAAAGPSKRRRADSYSVSRSPPPPARRQRRYSRSPSVMSRDSRSPSRSRSPARFRSRSPAPRGGTGGAGADRGYQRDVSPPPASGPGQAGRGRGRGYSYSRSRSPVPLPAERRGGGGVGGGRDGYGSGYRDRDDRGYRGRQYSPSRSRSRSPLPPADARPASMAGRGRRDSRSPARSPAGGGKRRRYDSSSRSRSPPRGSAKRGRVD